MIHSMTLVEILSAATRTAIVDALVANHGHRGRAGEALDVAPRTFARLLAEHVSAEGLAALAEEHRWPTRLDLIAFARSAQRRGV